MSEPAAPAKHSARRWTLLALLGTPLLLLLCYLLLLRTHRGDYLLHPHGGLLRVDLASGPPRFTTDRNYTIDSGYWFASASGLVLRPNATSYPDARWCDYEGYVSRPEAAARFPHLRSAGGCALEKFPVGALEQAHRALNGRDPVALENEARLLSRRFPTALAPRYWLVSAMCLNGKSAQAADLIEDWRADFEDPSHPWGPSLLRWMENDVKAAEPDQLEAWAEYGWTRIPSGGASKMGYAEFVGWIASRRATNPPHVNSLAWETTEWAPSHAAWGMAISSSTFLAMQGERGKAVETLLGEHVAGWPVAFSSGEMRFNMGMSYQSRTAGALSRLMVEGNATAAEMESAWEEAENLHERVAFPSDPSRLEMIRKWTDSEHFAPDALRAYWAWRRVPVMLAREAIRVRHFQRVNGAWPALDAESRPVGLVLQPRSPLIDPCDPRAGALRGSVTPEGDYVVRSVGPDGVDDAGAFAYDARTGASGRGDMLRKIEPSPRYLFPETPGYVYEDVADFQSRFPKGLPPDPFITMETSFQFTTLGGPKIWTHGPDLSYVGVHYGQRRNEPDIQYDPTNGFQSDGDIWLDLPMASDR
jgi:hypothetical protein